MKNMIAEKDNKREKAILRMSAIGILANLALAFTKALVGWTAHSTAVVLDALNNLTDSLYSLIILIGGKLAFKEADREHPYGHGRIEYLSAMSISLIILFAGITSLYTSFQKIRRPVAPAYSLMTIGILALTVGVKVIMSQLFRRTGRAYRSDALSDAGMDALYDVLISLATIIGAAVFLKFGFSPEAPLSLLISFVIIKSGLGMLKKTLNDIIGIRQDPSLSRRLTAYIASYSEVRGAYDLILHGYGPESLSGSVQIEVPARLTAPEIDRLTRKIKRDVYKEFYVTLDAIGIYAFDTNNEEAKKMWETITKVVIAHDHVKQLHGFLLDEETKSIMFDIIIDFETPDRKSLYEHILSDVKNLYPDYRLYVLLDPDYSD